MRTGQGFILTYAITSRQSYDEIHQFREQILRVKDADRVPIVLCGNKCDLEDERQVTSAEAQDMSKSWQVPFYETSALARINVEEAFFDLVREIRKETGGSTATRSGASRGGAKKSRARGCALL